MLPLTVTVSISLQILWKSDDKRSLRWPDISKIVPNYFVAASRRAAIFTLGER